jgi:hypothetical protein
MLWIVLYLEIYIFNIVTLSAIVKGIFSGIALPEGAVMVV